MDRKRWKHNGKWMPPYLTFTQVWNTRGMGRYWKRKLSKARRRSWKHEIRTGKPLNISGIESTVNWRDW